MPANTVRMQNPTVGDVIFPANAYRVLLRFSQPQSAVNLILVGSSLANGIPLLATFNNDPVLLFNVVGTAMRAEVSVLQTQFATFINTTQITRTPSGIT